jgi:hypothetical protein
MMAATGPDDTNDILSEFMTIEILEEQLAVIDQSLATIPDLPTHATRRNELFEERGLILRMIETLQNSDNREGNGSMRSASTSLSPSFSAHIGTSKPASLTSATGYSTPDMTTWKDHGLWDLTTEETVAQNEQDRIAQELA